MTAKRRVHKATDRAAKFFASQREQDELDFKAIEARYRHEVEAVTLRDGSKRTLTAYRPKVAVARSSVGPKPIARVDAKGDDALLDLAIAHQEHVVYAGSNGKAGEAEARQALKDRGVTFSREPKSIHSKVPAGRIGSIPKPTPGKAKPTGSDGTIRLWPGNTEKRLPHYMNRHYGIGDK